MSKSLAAKNLVAQVEKVIRAKIAASEVVSLSELRALRKDQPARILIVDDDESVRKSLQRLLEAEGYQVSSVQDAAQLSFVADQFNFDLILLDVSLPWLNGFELATLMREHAELRSIPLVFISGHQDMDSVKKGFASGGYDYITKPFDMTTVKKTISTLLELAR